MEEKRIRVYHTHTEVFPYKLGENDKIEKQLSIWNDGKFKYEPFAYMVHNDILYVPRGYNLNILEKEFNSTAIVVRDCDPFDKIWGINMTVEPRDDIQRHAIDFLTGAGKYNHTSVYSQQALILGTGIGKTYTTTNAIVTLGIKAIIITHQDKIKNQWIDTFKTKTNIPHDKLINVNGSMAIHTIMSGELEGYIYFINHQTISSYLRIYGIEPLKDFFKKINVGIKVFDEAHLSFKNVLRTDFFSNTKKTFYLTANFSRSDSREAYLFSKCFSSVCKITDTEILESDSSADSKRKHIIYVPVLYRSNPSYQHFKMATNMYGFCAPGFIKYALHLDEENTMIRHFLYILDTIYNLEGRILITVPTIDDTEFIMELIKKEYPNSNRTIGTINSRNSDEVNDISKQCSIICSTVKSCGVGVDLPKLRCVINLEPFSSTIITNQLSGRLREYSPDKDTYFFDLIDVAFSACERQYKTRLKCLKKKCKAIQIMNR